ncbi:hypothetical protein Sjap_024326 [Stephania japonica]|uniref:Serpin domain-containing protein n=1 Tax=Stephania japonica TaxID=461633 RepID=A0AAP0ELU9_9MAGN
MNKTIKDVLPSASFVKEDERRKDPLLQCDAAIVARSMRIRKSLLTSGFTGKTQDQLLSFLNHDTLTELNTSASRLCSLFKTKQNNRDITLCSSNGVWVDKSFSLRDSFKHIAKSIYEAKTEEVDFQTKKHLPHTRVKVGRFGVPKFKVSFGFGASRALRELVVHHNALVEVDEEGTEAAAVIAIGMMGSAPNTLPPPRIDFVADHPFMFSIRDGVNGVVLFMGWFVNPLLVS